MPTTSPAITIADESELRMHRQLADNPPDGERVSIVSIETAATVDVHRDRRDLSADNADRLESDAMLVRKGRRQQRPGFDRNADAFFFLERAFLEHAFQEQPRIGDLEVGAALDTELADRLPVLREAIVEDHARRGDRVLPASPLEVEIADLDLDFFRIGDSGVGGDEWTICPRRCRDEQSREQPREDLNALRLSRRTSSMPGGPFLAPPARTRGGSARRPPGCESSAPQGSPAAFGNGPDRPSEIRRLLHWSRPHKSVQAQDRTSRRARPWPLADDGSPGACRDRTPPACRCLRRRGTRDGVRDRSPCRGSRDIPGRDNGLPPRR